MRLSLLSVITWCLLGVAHASILEWDSNLVDITRESTLEFDLENRVSSYKIYKTAKKYKGSKSWRKSGCLHGIRYCGKYKCNLYVYDVLKESGAVAPRRHWYIYSPISANEWGNRRSKYVLKTGCYTNVRSCRKGDVVAFPVRSGSGHVGIVTSKSGYYISAGTYSVQIKPFPRGRKRVYWRYKSWSRKC